MTYYYTLETRNGDVDYEFTPDWKDVEYAIKEIIDNKSTDEIYEIMETIMGENMELEEFFYDELHDYFAEAALERHNDMIQREDDLRYDYYHDKL